MNAVWMRARADLRRRWRAWLVLALVAALGGGSAIAAAVGARRAETAYPRLLVAAKAMDVVLSGSGEDQSPEGRSRAFGRVRAMPEVADATQVALLDFARFTTTGGRTLGFPEVFALVAVEPGFGTRLNRFKFLEGRPADPRKASEIVVAEPLARVHGLNVGDELRLGSSVPWVDVSDVEPLRIVGIEIAPSEFKALSGPSIPGLHLTEAFAQRYPRLVERADLAVRLRTGPAGVAAFQRAIEHSGIPVEFGFDFAAQGKDVRRTNRFEAVALWILAGVIALASFAIVAQAISRQVALDSTEHRALAALGMSRAHLMTLGLVRVASIAVVASALSVVVAYLASPLTPIGLARLAEPRPGFRLDGWASAVGAAGMLVAIVLGALWPVRRAATVARADTDRGWGRSRAAATLSRVGGSPPATAGVRMAAEPGRGRSAVPVRSALIGAALAIATLGAALVFTSSFQHLVATPELSGYTFDATFGVDPRQSATFERALSADRDVERWAPGTFIDPFAVEGRRSIAMAVDTSKLPLSMIDGRAPSKDDEIAIGPFIARRLGVRLGDFVRVTGPRGDFPMEVVGRFVLPTFPFQLAPTGEGAVVSIAGLERIAGRRDFDGFFVHYRDGVDPRLATDRIRLSVGSDAFAGARAGRAEVENLQRISDLPIVLAALVAALALVTFGHALVTTVRRRARDLAILKTLGFVDRQVRATVAWQATAIAAAALLVSVPAGVAAGRWGWSSFVDQLGLVPVPVVPLVLALIVPATLLFANVVAALPARAAARTQPAIVLRAVD